jgi:hypothetical protein
MFVFAGVRVGVIRVIGGKKFFFPPKEADESEGWGDGVCFCVILVGGRCTRLSDSKGLVLIPCKH